MEYYAAIKEQSTDIPYKMNEPWRHYAKWKELDTKGHALYDFMYTRYPEETEP